MNPIYFYVKFCEEEAYARDFVDGRLYMNPLGYFRGLPDAPNDGRADSEDAPRAWLQPSQIGSIQIAGVRIAPSDLAAPVVVQDVDSNALNIMCLYAATPPPEFSKLSSKNLDAFRVAMRVPERCLSMGKFAVVIHSPRAFQERVISAVKREHVSLQAGPVSYFDAGAFSGNLARPLFAKRKEFAWQREYRIAVDRGVQSAKPYVLDVGLLADICVVWESATINDQVSWALPTEPTAA